MNGNTQNPKEIIQKYLSQGPFKARETTKCETHVHSKDLNDAAWEAGSKLMEALSNKFYNFPPQKNYMIGSPQYPYFTGLLAEVLKTFQNAFRLAEEGYYRSAFGELRDLLELVMKIKYFYEKPKEFNIWIGGKDGLFTTEDVRNKLFKGTELYDEINEFSNTLSRNRHGAVYTLDSLGIIITSANYYRKDLFEKWCKHMIMLKDLSIKIISVGDAR